MPGLGDPEEEEEVVVVDSAGLDRCNVVMVITDTPGIGEMEGEMEVAVEGVVVAVVVTMAVGENPLMGKGGSREVRENSVLPTVVTLFVVEISMT